MKKRLVCLDYLRILGAYLILQNHLKGYMRINFKWRWLQVTIGDAPFILSMFFVLSGYCLYYAYGEEDFGDVDNIVNYYKKRFKSIFIPYFIILIVWFVWGKELTDPKYLIALFPLEITLTQQSISSTWGHFYNGGTWFLSCLLPGYFLLPLLTMLIKKSSVKIKAIVLLGMYIICSSAGIFQNMVRTEPLNQVYVSPMIRTFEFVIGMLTCDLFFFIFGVKKNNLGVENKRIFSRIWNEISLVVVGMLVFAGHLYVYDKMGYSFFYSNFYNIFSAIFLIITCSLIPETAFLYKMADSHVVRFLSELTIYVYLIHPFVINTIKDFNITHNIVWNTALMVTIIPLIAIGISWLYMLLSKYINRMLRDFKNWIR